MTKSQLEDIGIVRSELTQAIDDNERLRSQIALNKALAEKMERELQKANNAKKLYGNLAKIGGVGIIIVGVIAFLGWTR